MASTRSQSSWNNSVELGGRVGWFSVMRFFTSLLLLRLLLHLLLGIFVLLFLHLL